MSVRVPSGMALILIGSGLYWVLASQLISSFTSLAPGLFRSPLGASLITVVGVIALSVGLAVVHIDFEELKRFFETKSGWVFVIPIALVASDVYLTLTVLSFNSRILELNPFVASAVQFGAVALIPFVLSYLGLSEGLALLMIAIGNWLFGTSKAKFVPFALVCGAASFGPFSNLLALGLGYITSLIYLLGFLGAGLLAALVYRTMKNEEQLLGSANSSRDGLASGHRLRGLP